MESTHEEIATALYGPEKTAPTTETATMGQPGARAASDPRPLLPRETLELAQYHDELSVGLGLDRSAREALIRSNADAVLDAQLGLDDYGVFRALNANTLRVRLAKERGTTPDPAVTREQHETLVSALRGEYGDDAFEDLRARTDRFVKTQPKLARAIAAAEAGSDPTLVRGLMAFVRAHDLGRA